MISVLFWLHKPATSRGQAAVGTLIIFISLLIVAAVAAGVLIQSSGSLQEKALSTGDAVREDVASGFHVVDVSGTDGSSGYINYITMIAKLPPGMPAINLDYVTIILGTKNTTSSLKFRGASGTTSNDNTGFNTWLEEEVGEMGVYHELIDEVVASATPVNLDIDIDLDGQQDSIVVCRDGQPYCEAAYSATHVLINLSSGELVYVPIYDQNGGPINLQNKADGESIKTTLEPVGSYGFLTAVGPEGAGGYSIPTNTIHLYLPAITLNEDLDDDGSSELMVINDTHLILFASSEGNTTEQYNLTSGLAFALGTDLSSGDQTLDVSVTMINDDASTRFGTVTISGKTSRASYIDENVTITVTPYKLYQGYYSAAYVQTVANHVPGILMPGDVIRFYMEAPRNIYEDELLRITLLPKNGVQTVKEFYMPNIISESSIHMYP